MRSLAERVTGLWEGERPAGALAPLLRLLSFPYAAAVGLRNHLYDRGILAAERLPVPVISVGNLTVGGTGKTPTVILLANLLRDRGRRPAVLSRGYGGKAPGPVNVVSDGQRLLLGWPETGDEPVLIARSVPGVPVLAGPQRGLTGRAALERFGADCLILDDALQHRALHRDLEIVLLDAARPLGNGFLLPRGPLRESPAALKRADLLIRTGGDQTAPPPLPAGTALPSFRGVHRPQCLVAAGTGRTLPLDRLRGTKVAAFAGLGRPEAFHRSLKSLGADLVAFRVFADHHPYSAADAEALGRFARESGAALIVTTEKDAVRLAAFPAFLAELLLLRVGMEISPAASFQELIFSRLAY